MNLKGLFPRASQAFIDLNSDSSLSPAVPQSDEKEPLGGATKGEKESLGRVTVSYRGFFVRPQDPDNFVASTKDLTDGLWRCGLIHGDNKWQIKLLHEQEQVAHFAQERIELKITWPEASKKSRQSCLANNQENTKCH